MEEAYLKAVSSSRRCGAGFLAVSSVCPVVGTAPEPLGTRKLSRTSLRARILQSHGLPRINGVGAIYMPRAPQEAELRAILPGSAD
jgi:hypothetical protein